MVNPLINPPFLNLLTRIGDDHRFLDEEKILEMVRQKSKKITPNNPEALL